MARQTVASLSETVDKLTERVERLEKLLAHSPQNMSERAERVLGQVYGEEHDIDFFPNRTKEDGVYKRRE